jgi:hypothetical protein
MVDTILFPRVISEKPIVSSRPARHGDPPQYLTAHYWWAYIHPGAVKLFERQWLVNLILWGRYGRLRDAALAEFGDVIDGTTLQVACVYGDLIPLPYQSDLTM